jgi:hypothetical protein
VIFNVKPPKVQKKKLENVLGKALQEMFIVSHAQWKWPLKWKVHKKPGELKYYVA